MDLVHMLPKVQRNNTFKNFMVGIWSMVERRLVQKGRAWWIPFKCFTLLLHSVLWGWKRMNVFLLQTQKSLINTNKHPLNTIFSLKVALGSARAKATLKILWKQIDLHKNMSIRELQAEIWWQCTFAWHHSPLWVSQALSPALGGILKGSSIHDRRRGADLGYNFLLAMAAPSAPACLLTFMCCFVYGCWEDLQQEVGERPLHRWVYTVAHPFSKQNGTKKS